MKVYAGNWKHGIRSLALVTYDDFCPEYSKWYDSGGDMSKDGVIERVVIGELHKNFPRVKFFFLTVPNIRYRWISFREFEVVKSDTYLLSKYPEWVEWVKEKIKKNNFYLGYHGWEHTGIIGTKSKAGTILSHDYCIEFTDRNEKDTETRTEKMIGEFERVGLPVERVFVPPAGGINKYLLEILANKNIFYTYFLFNRSCGYPEYYKTVKGKKLLWIGRSDAWVPEDVGKGYEEKVIDGLVNSNSALFFSNHFNNNAGVRNGITSNNIRCLKNTLGYVEEKYGEQVQYASYEEIMKNFEEQKKLKFKYSISRGLLEIKTENTKYELNGASFKVEGDYKKVVVLDKFGCVIQTLNSRSNGYNFIVTYPDLPFSFLSDGYVVIKNRDNKGIELYTDGVKNIKLERDNKILKIIKVNKNKGYIFIRPFLKRNKI